MITIAAALLVRSAYNTMHIDPSVQAGDAFVAEVSLPTDFGRFGASQVKKPGIVSLAEALRISRLFSDMTNSTISEIAHRLEASSGVVHVGAISTAPYRGHSPQSTDVQYLLQANVPATANTIHRVILRSMTSGAIPTLGMTLLYGRNFSGHSAEDENTVIVNEALAGKLGGRPSPLGQYIKCITWPAARIVGVVSNVREETLFAEVWPTAYFPFTQWGVADVDLVIRTSHGVSGRDAVHLMETSVHSIAPRAVVSHFEPLREMVESAGTLTRYTAGYLLALALLSVFLAGLCASSKVLGELQRRKTEIGIRMALGATRGDLIGLFVYSDLARGGIASLFGALLAWWFSHLLNYLLYDVNPLDPYSYFIGVTALIGSVAIVQILLLKGALQKNPRDLL